MNELATDSKGCGEQKGERQSARWGSTHRANGGRDSEPNSVSRMTSYIHRRNFGGVRGGSPSSIFYIEEYFLVTF
jgi:hypothetical protein